MVDREPLPFMPPPEPSVEHLRAAAADRVEHSTLRSAAREIGMSPTGLRKFLLGTAPYGPTMRRLRKWYVHHAAVAAGEVERDDVTAALSVLTYDLPSAPRRETADRMLEALGRGYDTTGRARPGWVAELRDLLKAS